MELDRNELILQHALRFLSFFTMGSLAAHADLPTCYLSKDGISSVSHQAWPGFCRAWRQTQDFRHAQPALDQLSWILSPDMCSIVSDFLPQLHATQLCGALSFALLHTYMVSYRVTIQFGGPLKQG